MSKSYIIAAGAAFLALAASASAIWHQPLLPQKQDVTNADNLPAQKSVARKAPKVVLVNNDKPLRTPRKISEPNFRDDLPVIYGSVVSSYADWFVTDDAEQIGYYGFQPESNIKFQPIAIHPNLNINGGGAFDNSRLYYHIWEMYADDGSETGITFHNYYCTVNTANWSMLNIVDCNDDQTNIAYDMTVDPVTGNLYAIQWGPYESGFCDFTRVDKSTGETTRIAKIPTMAILAADNFGALYTVDSDGDTYYIDKNDGSLIRLGSSGVKPQYIQSATVDPESNTIYWAAMSEQGGSLRRLDTHTGKAELIAEMPGDEEVTALFIEAPRRGMNAPAALEDVSLSYAGGNSIVSAKIPSKTFSGETLAGNVTVSLYIDGVQKQSLSGTPGQTLTFNNAAPDGSHTLVISAANDAGEGPKTFRKQWCGNDVPAAVTDLSLSLNGNVATLSWNAPTEGLNGGSVNPAEITYTVVRYPGDVTVASGISETSFSETLPDGIATYYYTVTPHNSLGDGEKAVSNSVFIGSAFTTPYRQTFDTEDSLEGFTIINNETGRGWYWWHNTVQKFQAMASRFNLENASDNWLILPAIAFKASSKYALRFSARVFDTDSPEKFEVTIGRDATVSAQDKTLLKAVTIKNEDAKIYEIPFTVDTDGTRNIAFHCLSPVRAYYLIIDDVEVVETASADGPAAVTDLSAVAAEGGRLEATVSCTLPTLTYSGSSLQSISAVRFYRSDEATPCGELTAVAPGQRVSWTDTNAAQGENVYRVAAFCGDAKGVEATVSVFVGYDKPLPVTDAKAVDVDGDNVRVTWTAPVKGVQGGDLLPSEISYKIYANTGDLLAEGLKECSFTDSRFAGFKGQYFVYYQIHAVYGNQQSNGTLTDFIVMGPDNQVPFKESFKDASLEHTPWTLSTLTGNISGLWGISDHVAYPTASAQDGDGGMAYFKGSEVPAGVSARMTSPKIDLFSASHPKVSFWVFIPGNDTRETLELQITHNDNVYTTLAEIDLKGEQGWKQFSFDIPRIHCRESTMIAFKATAAGYGNNICVDNISVTNGDSQYGTDLEAFDITLPDEFMPGETREFTVAVYNNGSTAVSDYTVSLYCDGAAVMSTKGKEINPGEVINYIFKATADESDRNVTYRYKGAVSCAGDENADNNFTPEKSITIGVSGINDAIADGVRIFASREGIVIAGAQGERFTVTDLQGRTIASGTAAARTVIPAAPGLYIVTTPTSTAKLLLP